MAVLGAMALLLLDRALRANVDGSLESVARTIAESVRNPSPFGPELDAAIDTLLGPGMSDRFFRLLDPLGRPDPRLVPRGRAQLSVTPEALRNAARGRPTFETLALPGAGPDPLRVLTLPVVDTGGTVRMVQVAASLEGVRTARAQFLLVLLTLAPLALGVAIGGGWFLARRALAPVDEMVQAARRIEAEDLSRRLAPTGGGDELDRLAVVLNDMLARLEASFATMRQFSADAAHELRTPLTILEGELDVALRATAPTDEGRRVLESCLEEVHRLTALVDDLLFLARVDAGHAVLERTRVDLAEVIADVRPALATLAEAAGIALAVDARAPVAVDGNARMLFRLVFNLGHNAIKYTPAGGRAEIRLAQQGGEARLDVADSGEGIAPAEQDRIFERFHRADAAHGRAGSGLGLALARSIVLAHGGRITVDSAVGRGSRFTVVLPLAAG